MDAHWPHARDHLGVSDPRLEIAAAAAALVADEGLEYGAAKRRALKVLGLPARTALPDNRLVEQALREHLALFHADTQPAELQALRAIALRWMDELAPYRPLLGGAIWNGTATRLSDIHLQLFCDDPKSLEIDLINRGIDYQPGEAPDWRGQAVPTLSLAERSDVLQRWVGIHLLLHDRDDDRGARLPDADGHPARGDARALRAQQAQGSA